MDDGPVTPALVICTAKRVITQHATGRCPQCQDDGCEMVDWARHQIKEARQ